MSQMAQMEWEVVKGGPKIGALLTLDTNH